MGSNNIQILIDYHKARFLRTKSELLTLIHEHGSEHEKATSKRAKLLRIGQVLRNLRSPVQRQPAPPAQVILNRLLEKIVKRNFFLPDPSEQPEDLEDLIPLREVEPLLLAGDPLSRFFRTDTEHSHEGNALHQKCRVIYWRFHRLSEDHLRAYVIASRKPTNDVSYALDRVKAKSKARKFQWEMFSIFRDAVGQTASFLGGTSVLGQFTTEERMQLWRRLYGSAPYETARAVNSSVEKFIPLEDIIDGEGDLPKKWQSFIKTMFCWTCEDVYELIYARNGDPASKKEAFNRYKVMPFRKQLEPLHLGGVNDIPVRKGGVYGRETASRRHQAEPLGDGYDVDGI